MEKNEVVNAATEHEGVPVLTFNLTNVRIGIGNILRPGREAMSLTALIAVAGILYWCPRCGQWMGEGSEGVGDGVPKPSLPPPPPRLLKAISTPMTHEPTPQTELRKRDENKLSLGGILENAIAKFGLKSAKIRYTPPSIAHGRRVDSYYDGQPRNDSRPHAHIVDFIRGDGKHIPIYSRKRSGEVVHESGTDVILDANNVYHWIPREDGSK